MKNRTLTWPHYIVLPEIYMVGIDGHITIFRWVDVINPVLISIMSEITTLTQLIKNCPEDFILDRRSLESRISHLQKEIQTEKSRHTQTILGEDYDETWA